MTETRDPPELGGLSRTGAAIAWLENGAGLGERARTQYRAAQIFGVSQASISQERKRRRLKRPMGVAACATVGAAPQAVARPAPAPEPDAPDERPGITFREVPYV